MANILNRFARRDIIQPNTIVDYVPFISSYGDFKKIEGIDVVINSWIDILFTPKGTVDHDPEMGVGLNQFIWEPMDAETLDYLKSELTYVLKFFDNRGTISDIKFSKTQSGKGLNVDIKVKFEDTYKSMTFVLSEEYMNLFRGI